YKVKDIAKKQKESSTLLNNTIKSNNELKINDKVFNDENINYRRIEDSDSNDDYEVLPVNLK
ncbi:12641_t:CDS:2, partial [Funneliformis geosporum]